MTQPHTNPGDGMDLCCESALTANRFEFGGAGEFTGLDYADQRYYASAYGRFNTPDPMGKRAKARIPGCWNRFAYTIGDPINGNDPRGLDDFDVGDYGDGFLLIPSATVGVEVAETGTMSPLSATLA